MRIATAYGIAGFAALIAAGRFTVPGHGLTGWPGLYEALAHIGVGMLLMVALAEEDWLHRRVAWISLLAITMLELAMFLAR